MIYIIRHGQTGRNKEKRLLGRFDDPLNDVGRQEAAEAAAYFAQKGIRFSKCYCSPLERAVETAQIVTGFDRSRIVTDDRLLEMYYGPYEGSSLQHLPPEVIYFFQDFANHPAPKGMEQLPDVVARLGAFLEELAPEPGENILISTHAIAMKGALEYLTPDSHGSYWSKYIGNCSTYAFDWEDGHYTMPAEVYAGT